MILKTLWNNSRTNSGRLKRQTKNYKFGLLDQHLLIPSLPNFGVLTGDWWWSWDGGYSLCTFLMYNNICRVFEAIHEKMVKGVGHYNPHLCWATPRRISYRVVPKRKKTVVESPVRARGIFFYIIWKLIWMALFWTMKFNFWVPPSWPKMALNRKKDIKFT